MPAPISRDFETPEQTEQYDRLTKQLRCLVCQNQSLADSHAELAADLREQVAKQIQSHQSDSQIIQYFVNRYGEFVDYSPHWQSKTALLWVGPFLFLLLGLLVIWRRLSTKR